MQLNMCGGKCEFTYFLHNELISSFSTAIYLVKQHYYYSLICSKSRNPQPLFSAFKTLVRPPLPPPPPPPLSTQDFTNFLSHKIKAICCELAATLPPPSLLPNLTASLPSTLALFLPVSCSSNPFTCPLILQYLTPISPAILSSLHRFINLFSHVHFLLPSSKPLSSLFSKKLLLTICPSLHIALFSFLPFTSKLTVWTFSPNSSLYSRQCGLHFMHSS